MFDVTQIIEINRMRLFYYVNFQILLAYESNDRMKYSINLIV